MSALRRLLSPLSYLRIQHEHKLKYDVTIPLGVASVLFILFKLLGIHLLGGKGLITATNGLLQIMPGFYIASLAAIATFNKKGMDEVMPGDPPALKISFRGKTKLINLSRRHFLSLLFGYLSFSSIVLFFVGMILNLSSEVGSISAGWVIDVVYFCYLFFVCNLLIATFLGLFYLSDRIHWHDPSDVGDFKIGDEESK